MEDLSHLLADGPVSALVPTSQSGGGVPHDNRRARTAPGTEPAASQPGDTDPAPRIEAITVTTPNRAGPAGTRAALMRSNPGEPVSSP